MTGREAGPGWAWWAAFAGVLAVVFVCGFIIGSGAV